MPGFSLLTVPQKGWSKTKNGALLRLAKAAGFEAFLTADQSLQYQQNLSASKLRIIVFAAPSNRMEHIGPLLIVRNGHARGVAVPRTGVVPVDYRLSTASPVLLSVTEA